MDERERGGAISDDVGEDASAEMGDVLEGVGQTSQTLRVTPK